MREHFTQGSVRGEPGDRLSYRVALSVDKILNKKVDRTMRERLILLSKHHEYFFPLWGRYAVDSTYRFPIINKQYLMKSAKEIKVNTSVVLSQELLHTVDYYAVHYESRSQFIETALRVFIAHLVREEHHAQDLDILNRCADELNQEVEDALTYQVPL